jgi:replicative DNA helicase
MTNPDDLAHRLLGTILANPEAATLAIMLVGPDRWLHPWPNADTVAIARAIQQITLRGDLPDPITVTDQLGDHPSATTLLPDLPRLAEAANLVPQRAEELRRHAILLTARMTIDGFAHRLTDPEADPVALSQELIARVSEFATAGSRERSVSTLAHELIAQYDAIRDGTRPDGLRLHHRVLDTYLGGGIPYGRMTILGARPSEGKTSLLCNWIDATLRTNHPVVFFTFDDDPELSLQRLACIHAGVSYASARSGTFRPATEARYKAAYQWLIDSPLEIVSDHDLSPLACRAKLHGLLAGRFAGELPLVAVDFLQTNASAIEDYDKMDRRNAVLLSSRQWKETIETLHLPGIVLAQLKRDAKGAPHMEHLKESGDLEQDANVIILIERPGKDNPQKPANQLLGHIRKNKTGNLGTAVWAFSGWNFRYVPWDDATDVHLSLEEMAHEEAQMLATQANDPKE